MFYESKEFLHSHLTLDKMKIFQLFAGLATASSSLDTLVKGTADLREMMEQVVMKPPPTAECIKEFLDSCLYCVENIQLGSPFCDESNPNFNGIVCAIQLNVCLVQQLEGIFQRPQCQ